MSVVDMFIGVLTRCLTSLEQKDIDGSKSTDTSDALREVGRSLGIFCYKYLSYEFCHSIHVKRGLNHGL